MAKKSGIRWIKPPSGMMKAIQQYGKKALVATHATCAQVGLKMQNEARDGAPWEDKSGNARDGLFFAVDGFGLDTKVGSTRIRDEKTGQFIKGETLRTQGETAGDDKTVVVVLGHTMEYGVRLELDYGRRYAIIEPTMNANMPVLRKALKDLFK